MRLNQFGGDQITATVVNAMLQSASILPFVEFYPIVGNADYTRKAASASGGKFRALNSDYADNQVTPAFANPTLKIYGDKVQVDRAHERRGSDVPSVRAAELLNFAKNLGLEFQDQFINGDSGVDANSFNGVKKIVPASQKITAATNGLSIPLGNSDTNKTNQQKFLELLDQLIGSISGGADILTMDSKTISRLTRIAEGQVVWSKDDFGKPLAFYNGIPLIDAGYDKSGNKIIPHTEVVGTSGAACTSIYAFKFGEASDLSVATNVGVEVKDLGLVGVHYTHSVDFDADVVLLKDKAVGRLEGLIIS